MNRDQFLTFRTKRLTVFRLPRGKMILAIRLIAGCALYSLRLSAPNGLRAQAHRVLLRKSRPMRVTIPPLC
jgi:hypothetical protein